MEVTVDSFVVVFDGFECISSGKIAVVTAAAKTYTDAYPGASLLCFDGDTGRPVELDLRGSLEEVLARLPKPAAAMEAVEAVEAEATPRGPGRPRLGVVAREVTLLPRHWAWLNAQPGGASVALRKLVEEARRTHAVRDAKRESQEACYRFIVAVGGNLPEFEAASRALFAGDALAFAEHTATWPPDVQRHALRMGRVALAREEAA